MLRKWSRVWGCRYRRKFFLLSTMTVGMLLTVYSIMIGCISDVYSIPGVEGSPGVPGRQKDGSDYLQFLTHHNRNLKNSMAHQDNGRFKVPPKLSGLYQTDSGHEVRTGEADHRSRKEDEHIYMDEEYASRNDYSQYSSDKSGQRRHKDPDHRNCSRNLPQAIIIGVKKGGTRALLEFLRIHPNVKAPGPEPHFFDKHYKKGLRWYRSQMPEVTPGQMTIEKTPSYFVTKGIPERVYKMSKKVKLIVVVRDPVTRAISDYAQLAERRPDIEPFENMVFINNKTKIINTSWTVIKIGVYAQHFARWLEYFPLRQMHFVSGENLIENPASELTKVQKFLGLKNLVTEEHFSFNRTKGFPCYRKDLASNRWHCLNNGKGRPHPDVNPAVVRRLQDFYRPFNIKLYSMIGQDMGWS